MLKEGLVCPSPAHAGCSHPDDQDINAEGDECDDEQLKKFFSFKMLRRECSNPLSRSVLSVCQ